MPYKTKEARREYYEKNKDEINRKRREYDKQPERHKRKSEQWKKWRDKNPEKARAITNKSKKTYDVKCKKEVFEHYGKKCNCCGESNQMFLTMDHINGGGTTHRKSIKGEKITSWLYRNNFPKGFQTLCFNCNWGKHINGGICPHQEESPEHRPLNTPVS